MRPCLGSRLAAAGLALVLSPLAIAGETQPLWDPRHGPEEAIAYLVFARPAVTLASIGAWARALNEGPEGAGGEAAGDIKGDVEATLGFQPDLANPIALAFFAPTHRPDPIAAARPADAATAAPPDGVRKAGEWWLWSRTGAGLESFAKAFSPPPELPQDTDLAIHVRVAKAYPTIAPILRMQLAMLAGALRSQDMAGPEIEIFESIAGDVLDLAGQVETADAVVRLTEVGIRVTKTVRAKRDSPLSAFMARHGSARAGLAEALPAAPFRFAAASPDLARLTGLLVGEVLDAGDAAAGDREAIFKAYDALAASLGGEAGIAMGKGPAGKARILVAAAVKDEAAARGTAEKLARDPDLAKALKAGLGGDVAYLRDAGKAGDLRADRLAIRMDEEASKAMASFLGTPPEWILAFPRGFCVAGVGDGAAVGLAELAGNIGKAAGPAAQGTPAAPAAFRLEVDLPTTLAIAGGPSLLEVLGVSMAPYLKPAPPMTLAVGFAPGSLVAEAALPLADFKNVTDAFRTALEKGIEESMKGFGEERQPSPGPNPNWTLEWIGKPAPEVKGKTAGGGEIALSALRGKVVILAFWATWCPPCRAEIPGFIDLQKTYGEKGLAILGVTDEPASDVKPFVEKQRMNYPTIVEAPDLPAPYDKIQAIPTTFVIDRDGKIVAIHVGMREKAEFEEEVKPLLAGK